MIAKLINNLQIDVKNVHVRYEGSVGEGGNSFCLGATLGSALFKVNCERWKIRLTFEESLMLFLFFRARMTSSTSRPSAMRVSSFTRLNFVFRFSFLFSINQYVNAFSIAAIEAGISVGVLQSKARQTVQWIGQ